MQLHGSFTSPYVRHCRIVMAQGQIEHDFIEAGFEQSAALSPSKKVPFLIDGDVLLSDSSSIVRYLRESQNQDFLNTIQYHDLFSLISTLMDSAINLFYLEKEGINVHAAAYLQRQKLRVDEGLVYLNQHCPSTIDLFNDAHLRLAIFLSWGLFRQRINLNPLENLQAFLQSAEADAIFSATKPA
ncbi:MAG: glutathione S-transferase family protein [Pseudomonadales bacterium]|nr:glutathione S-transferase family protein [Pseudomonadales bacterium]